MINTFFKPVSVILIICFTTLSCKDILPTPKGQFSDQIRLNQIGYYPKAVKNAVIINVDDQHEFSLVDNETMAIVYTGQLSAKKNWELAGETIQIADFTEFTEEGEYMLYIENMAYSYPFKIEKNVLHDVFLGSIKALYYQRIGMPLEEKYAGKWNRPMAHPDDSVLFHPSSGKMSGYISSPKGWYDAGDYNKYVVNGSFPLGQFYRLYERYPTIIKDKDLNIPESGNGRSDYLDELKYEMDWLLTMQDKDGGLFHKLTAKNFEGMVMPHEAISQRYIVGKGTAATLDFAACAAQAYRVFRDVEADYATKCLESSRRAYDWAFRNPDVEFLNPDDITTGQYGDKDFADEWFWANAELFISTSDEKYLNNIMEKPINFEFIPGDNWTKFMRFMGMFTLVGNKNALPQELTDSLKKGVLQAADELVARTQKFDYFQPLDDFQWGSNSDVLNAALLISEAYRLDPKPVYLQAVQHAVDYVLGTNATGYSFVTGFGDKTPMFIHHRQSEADGIVAPVPGLISGGPNFGKQDATVGVIYPENAPPMKSWVDQEPSYASNEICLNWNAPLTYVVGFLEQESN